MPRCEDLILIEIRMNDIVSLKEKVLKLDKMYNMLVDRVVLQMRVTHMQLLESQFLKDCPTLLDSHAPDNTIDVFIKPRSSLMVACDKSGNMKVIVLPKNKNEMIEI